jgi:hypothetical protein
MAPSVNEKKTAEALRRCYDDVKKLARKGIEQAHAYSIIMQGIYTA